MISQSSSLPRRSRIPFGTASLALVGGIVLGLALREWIPSQTPPILVTASVIAILDFFPIYLDPSGELRLTVVIAIPMLVLFGWPAALTGTALGMAVGLLHRHAREVFTTSSERLASLIVAAAFATAFSTRWPHDLVGAVVVASLTYTVFRTLIISARMHAEEAITWPRAISFLVSATFLHLAIFAGVAAIAVWIVSNDLSTTSRLLVPVLAAGVTLQLYLTRFSRGREQRRVLAAVSVLAAAVDAKDPYTADHSAEVAGLSRRVARILNLDEPEVHRVYLAGLLHDVGKTAVPPAILLKPGKLTDDEWQIMQSHVEAGVRIVDSIFGLSQISPIVGASHERLDGRGYPKGLSGDEIPIGSRINLVVDAYNALTTNRPYRPGRSPEEALVELAAHSGTQFDPRVVDALRMALGYSQTLPSTKNEPTWLGLLRQPAFALLWGGELISFLGDQVFFIALSLWIYKLTGSAAMLATTLIAATVGQGLLGFFAGALVDRQDRRGVLIATDIGRAAAVALLPFALLRSIPAGLALLIVLNVGTVFFRAAVYALLPSVVRRDDLATANALFQATERIAEVVGGVLGGAIVLSLGYQVVFYIDAVSFLVSASCVGLMPVAWKAGLEIAPRKQISTEIGEGLRFIWRTPLHRILALLILPGYLTLAFDALQTPMIVKTAGLSVVAYGVINSVLGVGKLVAAIMLTGAGKRWVSLQFIVTMYLLTAVSVALFGVSKIYVALIGVAFLHGFGNIATTISNLTMSMAYTPSGILGRLIASRQVFIAIVKVFAMLVFGYIADFAGPPFALITLGLVSGVGVAIVWFGNARQLHNLVEAQAPGGAGE
jgi:HD-GYP domain-containing protein (c-di-GMP phosphodiesterase class II)/MFS family permease